jgi:hypothetical protein
MEAEEGLRKAFQEHLYSRGQKMKGFKGLDHL